MPPISNAAPRPARCFNQIDLPAVAAALVRVSASGIGIRNHWSAFGSASFPVVSFFDNSAGVRRHQLVSLNGPWEGGSRTCPSPCELFVLRRLETEPEI